MDIYFLLWILGISSITGWVIELISRRFSQEHGIVNPGFLSGPYLPIYGFGSLFFYLTSFIEISLFPKVILAGLIATLIELITGIFFFQIYKIRLWDYSDNKFNFKGFIAPLYSFYWVLLSIFFFLVWIPLNTKLFNTFTGAQSFIFTIGAFYGLIFMDAINSFDIAEKIRVSLKKMREHNVKNLMVINYVDFKENVRNSIAKAKSANMFSRFVFPMQGFTKLDLSDQLNDFLKKQKNMFDNIKEKKVRFKRKVINDFNKLEEKLQHKK